VACVVEFILEQKFKPANLLTLIASSVTTASLASLILGGIVMFIIIISKKFKINPDNIATPIASSLGDVVTLAILAGIGTFFYTYSNFSTHSNRAVKIHDI
jgi:solute carrier family 41